MTRRTTVSSTPHELLDELYLQYGDFYVHRLGKDGAIWPEWKRYSEIGRESQPNQRQILPNEIVFDCDYEQGDERTTNIRRNMQIAAAIRRACETRDLAHSTWRSGGKGMHIHIFIRPEDAELLAATGDLPAFKRWFIDTVAGPIADLGVLDYDTTGRKTLIQLEHQLHRKGVDYKLKRRGTHLVENDVKRCTEAFYDQQTVDEATTVDTDGLTVSALDNELLQYCRENQVTDCRDRLLFFAANRLAATEDEDTTLTVLREMNARFGDGGDTYESERRLKQRMKTAYQSDKYPSYEWMYDHIDHCDDADLRAFAADWMDRVTNR
jgi:hypothetical protein